MSNFLTAEFPDKSPSTGAWLWSSSILFFASMDMKFKFYLSLVKIQVPTFWFSFYLIYRRTVLRWYLHNDFILYLMEDNFQRLIIDLIKLFIWYHLLFVSLHKAKLCVYRSSLVYTILHIYLLRMYTFTWFILLMINNSKYVSLSLTYDLYIGTQWCVCEVN